MFNIYINFYRNFLNNECVNIYIYFKDIEILYEKYFKISKYCPISNSNVNTVITDMNNIESSTNSYNSNEVYNINNNKRNNIFNNRRISDSENININISDNENDSVVTINVVNSSIGKNRVDLSNFLNNEYVPIIYLPSWWNRCRHY